MKKFAKICLTIAVIGYILGQLTFPAWTIRYRLTLVAEVDGRQVAGSGVVETHWQDNGPFFARLIARPWSTSFRGEAVVVDLGKPGMLFALLRGDPGRKASEPDPHHLLVGIFADTSVGSTTASMLRRIAASRAPVPVPLNDLPLLVRFRDIADPRSVERVDPSDLAQKFGPGVRLRSASLAVVPNGWWPFDWFGWPKMLAGEPVTRKNQALLHWLDTEKLGFGLVPVKNKPLSEYTVEETIHAYNFVDRDYLYRGK